MIRIRTASRLHFGLLSLHNSTGRSFGGVGLMVERPGVEVFARHAPAPVVKGTLDGSLRQRVEMLLAELAAERPLEINVAACAPEHAGLGTGTQLSLAVAKAVRRLAGEDASAEELAHRVARGQRSAIGVHGFERGGFLIDGGKGNQTCVAPLVARLAFPPDWPILLIRPPLPAGLHGEAERRSLCRPDAVTPRLSGELARLALLALAPAIAERDYQGFAEALSEYNRKVGEAFAFAQAGCYAHPLLAEIVDSTRCWDFRGIGQSSWGPTLFAFCDEPERRDWLCAKLAERFNLAEEAFTKTVAQNGGAEVCNL